MPDYVTPGIYIEEAGGGPRPIAPVATALPVFIGCTARTRGTGGEDLTGKAVEIASYRDFEACFGAAPVHPVTVTVEKREDARGRRA